MVQVEFVLLFYSKKQGLPANHEPLKHDNGFSNGPRTLARFIPRDSIRSTHDQTHSFQTCWEQPGILMAIQFNCSNCGNKLEVPDGSTGKQAKCPACSSVLPVPGLPLDDQDTTTPDTTTPLGSAAYDPPQQAIRTDGDQQPTPDDRMLATLAHLSGLIGIFAGGLIGFIGPLLIYLFYRESSSYVGDQAKEALNFQISLFLLAIALVVVNAFTCFVLWPLLFVPLILQLVFGIIASLSVWSGESYRYPVTLRLV